MALYLTSPQQVRPEFFDSFTPVDCPCHYWDKHGEETTVLHNDGQTLRMVVRGVEFAGDEFDGLEPAGGYETQGLGSFTLIPVAIVGIGKPIETARRSFFLDDFALECEFPILVVGNMNTIPTKLKIHIDRRKPAGQEKLGRFSLQLELNYEESVLLSSGKHGYFDGELYDLQKLLPAGVYLKACTNCAFADSHPVGRGSFVGLACFRNIKQEFRAIKDKDGLMRIWDKRAAFVQDTYLCPEFEPQEWLLGK